MSFGGVRLWGAMLGCAVLFAAMPLSADVQGATLPACEWPGTPSIPGPERNRDHRSEERPFVVHGVGEGSKRYLALRLRYPVDEQWSAMTADTPPPTSAATGTVWLWSEWTRWLLVPAGMDVVDAAVGVNGSIRLILAAPATSGNVSPPWLVVTDDGACVGCALGHGARYFPEWVGPASEGEFLYCSGNDRPVRFFSRANVAVRFRYEHGARIEGIALRSLDEDATCLRTLRLAKVDRTLSDRVLSDFERRSACVK